MNTIAHLEDELKKAKRDLNFYKTICNRFKSKNKKQKEVIDKATNWTIKYQTEWCQEDEVISDLSQLLDILKEVDHE